MQVSVEEMLKRDAQSSSSNQKVSYFNLKNDGDYAIVRFLHKDINDFDVLDVHNVPMGNYNKSVNCLRTYGGNADECALCKANVKDETTKKFPFPISRKIYIHMIQYSNPQSYTEVVWERGDEYRKKLNQYAQDYGDLYNTIYKIVRHGEAGVKGTTYDILPMPKDRFNPNDYAFDPKLLNYKKALGTVVYDADNAKMENYLRTGRFVNKTDNIIPRPTQEPSANFKTQFIVNEVPLQFNEPQQIQQVPQQPTQTVPIQPRQTDFVNSNNSYNSFDNQDFNFGVRRKF